MSWGNLVGGLASAAVSGYGAKKSGELTEKLAERDIAYQKEFAQQGIQWKVNDAKAAGLHPLAALGANTISYSPQRIQAPNRMEGVARGLSQAGSAVGNLTSQTATGKRLEALTIQAAEQDVISKTLGNDIQRRELQALSNTTTFTPDSMAVLSGQPNSAPSIKVNGASTYLPSEHTVSTRMGTEAGTSPLEASFIDSKGRLTRTLGNKPSEPMESDIYAKGQRLSNQIGDHGIALKHWNYPNTQAAKNHRKYLKSQRPKSPHPNKEFRFSPFMNQWKLVTKKGGKSEIYTGFIHRKTKKYTNQQWR